LQQTLLSIITEIIDLDHKNSATGHLDGKSRDLQLSSNTENSQLRLQDFYLQSYTAVMRWK